MTAVEACGAYAMRRFSVAFFWLQGISKRSATEIGQPCRFPLTSACFQASHLCFKLTYFLQHRRLCRACTPTWPLLCRSAQIKKAAS